MKIDGPIGCWFHGAFYPVCDIVTSDYNQDSKGIHFKITANPHTSFPSRLLEHFQRDGCPGSIQWVSEADA